MKRAWDKVRFYVKNNALHKKSGMRIADMSEKELLKHLFSEVKELIKEPSDIAEMADILAILFHHAQNNGIAFGELEDKILEKMEQRLEIPEINEMKIEPMDIVGAKQTQAMLKMRDEIERLENEKLFGTNLPQVAGRTLTCSHAEFETACQILLKEEQEKIAPDTHLIGVLCDAVRLSREYCDSSKIG